MSIPEGEAEDGRGRPALPSAKAEKADLVSDAIAQMSTRVPAPDTGLTRNDLVEPPERRDASTTCR